MLSKVQSCGPSDPALTGMVPMQSACRPFWQNQQTTLASSMSHSMGKRGGYRVFRLPVKGAVAS